MKFDRLFSRTFLILITNLALLTCLVNPAESQAKKTFLWKLQSQKNTLYILGSIHVLRQQDYPLPAVIQEAFNDAEHLVFEVDLAKINNPQLIQQKALPDKPNESLQNALDSETYNLAKKSAAEIGLPIETFNQVEPWFFSIAFTSMKMLQLGFNSTYGIDQYLYRAGTGQKKKISALETFEQQLDFFDKLSVPTQRELVKQSLLDLKTIESSLNLIVNSWKNGNTQKLEAYLLKDFKRYPELQKTLLTNRNKTWVLQIEPLINQSEDYLIVVGAAHLLGSDGLIQQMQRKGYKLQQL